MEITNKLFVRKGAGVSMLKILCTAVLSCRHFTINLKDVVADSG